MSCPICQKKSRVEYRPFCSKRCADIDLGRWLDGRYAIPSDEDPVTDEGAGGSVDPPDAHH